jgi:hypothetical protein
MAKPKPEKKRAGRASADQGAPDAQLRIGDRLSDETGEYEIVARP